MPRKSGTCTRVPFHISTLRKPGTSWACKVWLDHSHTFHRPTWILQARTTSVLFAEVEKLDELENILVRAQAALLQPLQEWKHFVHCPMSEIERSQGVEFSPCQVRIDIESSDADNLSVYDLPGLFHQTSSPDHEHLPELVFNMVSEYISAPKTIVLLVIPMTNDPEISTAAGLVGKREAKDRTMAVLTKPDRLEDDTALSPWREMLGNDPAFFGVGHGYYVTKQPTQGELRRRVCRQDALATEEQFFRQKPWSTDLVTFKAQFGTANIQKKVSTLLHDTIKSNLPMMGDAINSRISDIDEQLKDIPVQLSDEDALNRVRDLLNKVAVQLDFVLNGTFPRTQCMMGGTTSTSRNSREPCQGQSHNSKWTLPEIQRTLGQPSQSSSMTMKTMTEAAQSQPRRRNGLLRA